MSQREAIENRFESDMDRVSYLISLFEGLPETGTENRPHILTDLLRAAVVFLHAGLEDFLRSIAEWRLPEASPKSLERIPLAGSEKEKFTLVELAEFRGQSVDSVIAASVESYLERSISNNVSELTELLKRAGINYAIPKGHRDKLAAMMSRRHRIAHRVDRDPLEVVEPGMMQRGQSIEPKLVWAWREAVIEVGEAVLKEL